MVMSVMGEEIGAPWAGTPGPRNSSRGGRLRNSVFTLYQTPRAEDSYSTRRARLEPDSQRGQSTSLVLPSSPGWRCISGGDASVLVICRLVACRLTLVATIWLIRLALRGV